MSLPLFFEALKGLIDKGLVSSDSFVLCVNDGSSDGTWELLQQLCSEHPELKALSLSRNRGHQNALFAGLMEVRSCCDLSISVDCDGQDDLAALEEMVRNYHTGAEIVYGVRSDRSTDTVFKRSSAQAFYKLLRFFGVEVMYNHADYRLMSKRALEALSQYREVNLFLRGMVPLLGFKTATVTYARAERLAGETHYPLSKMIGLALDGITSLSIKPIRYITIAGLVVSVAAFVALLWILITWAVGYTVPGWTSLGALVSLLGGMQLISLGVLGEYLGKCYLELKDRPRYLIDETCSFDRGEAPREKG